MPDEKIQKLFDIKFNPLYLILGQNGPSELSDEEDKEIEKLKALVNQHVVECIMQTHGDLMMNVFRQTNIAQNF
jgi:hypothetical protein